MKNAPKKLTVTVGVMMLGISVAYAQQDIVSFTTPTIATLNTTGTYGFSFDVTSPITVIGLSTFTNTPPTGPVSLWNSSHVQIASAIIVPGAPLTADGYFYYEPLSTALTLPVGTYFVGALMQAGVQDYTFNTVGLSSIPGVTFLDDAYNVGPSLAFPGSSFGYNAAAGGGDFGGNVVVGSISVPEPESVLLISAGLAALAAVACKKRV